MQIPSKKVWFITGCSSGFGLALATEVLRTGEIVAVTGRSLPPLLALQDLYPETCWPYIVDVSEVEQVTEVVHSVVEKAGRLDVVVNNAGYGIIGSLEETTDDQIERNFATNLFGAMHVIRAVLPTLRAQRGGRIINISAAAAISNYAGFCIYGAAKSALEGLSEGLLAEVKPLGIKVTLVQPGPFRTDFISRSLEKAPSTIADYTGTVGKFAAFLQKVDGQQPGDPAKAARAIIRLSELETPTFRVPLGKYALDKAERILQSRLRELEAVKSLNLETEFNPNFEVARDKLS